VEDGGGERTPKRTQPSDCGGYVEEKTRGRAPRLKGKTSRALRRTFDVGGSGAEKARR